MPDLVGKYQTYVEEMIQCGQVVVGKETHNNVSSSEWFLIHNCMGSKFHVVMMELRTIRVHH